MGDLVAWAQLGAVGVVTALLVWIITKGVPGLLDKFDKRLDDKEAIYREDLKAQRADFREELKAHRDQSQAIATSGHESVKELAAQVSELKQEIKERKTAIKNQRSR